MGAYQIAVVTLLGTMLLGAWLLRPVSDRWAGSGEPPITGPARAARADDGADGAALAGRASRSAHADPIISSRVERAGSQPSDLARPIDRRNQHRRVAVAPIGVAMGNRAPDHALGAMEDLADAEADAAAEVEQERLGGSRIVRRCRLEGEPVRVGEVEDVDVVADRGAVRRVG